MDYEQLIVDAEHFAKEELSKYDASHDFSHVQRVQNTAVHLAGLEMPSASAEMMAIIRLGALLHDVADYKYSGSESAGEERVRGFLQSKGSSAELIARVLGIIAGVGFKNELGRGNMLAPPEPPLEVRIVQDADRLDAIGAVGIARCMIYNGAKNHPLHDGVDRSAAGVQLLSKEEYMHKNSTRTGTAIEHFYEKLLRLKDLMKTNSGRELAQGRHQFMEMYLDQFYAEWRGDR